MKHTILFLLLPLICFSQKQITDYTKLVSNDSKITVLGAFRDHIFFHKTNSENVNEILKTQSSLVSQYTLVDSFLPDTELEKTIDLTNEIYFVLNHKNKTRSLWKLNKSSEKLVLSIPNIFGIQVFEFKGKVLGSENDNIYVLKTSKDKEDTFEKFSSNMKIFPKTTEGLLVTYSYDFEKLTVSVYDSLLVSSNLKLLGQEYRNVHDIQKLNDDYVITITKHEKVSEYNYKIWYLDYLWSFKSKEIRFLDQNQSTKKQYFYKEDGLHSTELEFLSDAKTIFRNSIFNINGKKNISDSTLTNYVNYYYPWGLLGPSLQSYKFSEIQQIENSFFFVGNNDSFQKPNSGNINLLHFDSELKTIKIYPLGNKSELQGSYSLDALFYLKKEENLLKIYPDGEGRPKVALDLKNKAIVRLDSLSETSKNNFKVSKSEVFVVEANKLYAQNLIERTKNEIVIRSNDIVQSRILKYANTANRIFLAVEEDQNTVAIYCFDGIKMDKLFSRDMNYFYISLSVFEALDNKIFISFSNFQSKRITEFFIYDLESSSLDFLIASDRFFNNDDYLKFKNEKIDNKYIFSLNNFSLLTDGTSRGSKILIPDEVNINNHFIANIRDKGLLIRSDRRYYLHDSNKGDYKELVELYDANIIAISGKYVYYSKESLLFRSDLLSSPKLLYTFNSTISTYKEYDITQNEFLLNANNGDLIYFRVTDEKIIKIVNATNIGSNGPFFYKMEKGQVEYLFVTRNSLGDVINYKIYDINTEKVVSFHEKGFKNGQWYFLDNTAKNILVNQVEDELEFYEVSKVGFEKVLILTYDNVGFIRAIRNHFYDKNILINTDSDDNEMSILNLNNIKGGVSKINISGILSFYTFLDSKSEKSFFVLNNRNNQEPVEELWVSDGTVNNTIQLSNYFNFDLLIDTTFGDYYYSAYDKYIGNELFMFNNNSKVIKNVTDIYKGLGSSFPQKHFKLKENIYTMAFTPFSGVQLWLVDSTSNTNRLLSKNSEVSNVKVYPNPSYGQFINISIDKLEGNESINIQVFSYSGQLISESNILNNESINLSALNSGIYILKFKTKSRIFYSRIVIM